MNGRTLKLLAGLALVLCWMAALSFGYLRSQRAAAITACDDLETCRQLAGRIKDLSRRPSLALEMERQNTETSGPIERAAAAAGMGKENSLRIAYETPQRVGDTVFKERPIRINVRKVQLKQVTELLYRLSAGDRGLEAKSLRLRAPRAADAAESWDAEIVLAYLVYDPPHVEKLEK